MSTMSSSVVSEITNDLNTVLQLTESKIDQFLASKTKFGITSLSKDITSETGFTFTFVYSIVSLYVGKRTDLVVRKGAKNPGISKK
jgi:hypothetical protein